MSQPTNIYKYQFRYFPSHCSYHFTVESAASKANEYGSTTNNAFITGQVLNRTPDTFLIYLTHRNDKEAERIFDNYIKQHRNKRASKAREGA